MGTVGPLYPVEANRYVHITATIRMRSGDARVEQHNAVTRLIGLRLLANKIGTNDGRNRDPLLRMIEFGNDNHERIVDSPPLSVLGEMHLIDANIEIHLVAGDRVARYVCGSTVVGRD